MDLKDGMTKEEIADAAAREQRRVLLLESIAAQEDARKQYDAARNKVRAASDAEKARAKKAADKIAELKDAAEKAHSWVRHCNESERSLLFEFVPRDLVIARDQARSLMAKATREYEKHAGNAAQLRAVIEQKSQRRIPGPRYDKFGQVVRDDSGKRIIGQIPNPIRFTSDEEKASFEARAAKFDLEADEAKANLDKIAKVYSAAESALSDAMEAAYRG